MDATAQQEYPRELNRGQGSSITSYFFPISLIMSLFHSEITPETHKKEKKNRNSVLFCQQESFSHMFTVF